MARTLIDVARFWPRENKTIFAFRYPEDNLSTYTQLSVHESQEAIFFSKGKMIAKFEAGKHTLNTENLPVLRRLMGIPFGGKNPFTAEVWFVSLTERANIDWKTDRMNITDADYGMHLPLVARGRYALKVKDAEKFLLKIVGTKDIFDQDDLTDQFYGDFSSNVTQSLSRFMNENRIGFNHISNHINDISQYLKDTLLPLCEEWGFDLRRFNVTGIEVDTSTEEGKILAESIRLKSSQQLTGRTWQQQQMFDMAKGAVEGMSKGNGGMLGAMMAMNMMGGMGGAAAGMMQPQYGQPINQGGNAQQEPQPQAKMVYCSNCAKKFPSTTKFCPHCGDPYNPCPKCGTDNDQNARRCVSCGTPLQAEGGTCPHCNAPLAAGAPFCGNCGKQVQSSDSCIRCGAALPPSVKFCPKCGNKRS